MEEFNVDERISLIYSRLYEIGKSINETVEVDDLYDLACDFATDELNFEKAIIFEHDDHNGWFKVVKQKGYDNPAQEKILYIINLLLSGEVIEYLRVKGEPIIHTKQRPKKEVEALLKSLFLSEAYFELFGGDREVPYGLIIVGNGLGDISKYSRLLEDSLLMMALGNFMVQLSNTINNSLFYKAWQSERTKLEENIAIRTKKIEEQNATFETIYKTTKDGIAILDLETTAFLDMNPAYCEMTGFSKEELLRTSCVKLSIAEDIEKSKRVIEEVKEKGYVTSFIKTCLGKDGKKVIVNMSLSLMDDKKRVLVSAKDITQEKANDEYRKQQDKIIAEQAKLVSMGEMIGNIAHQWRQPLSVISTLATGIKFQKELGQNIDDEKLIQSMGSIDTQAQYLSKTIDDFKNFIKEDAEKSTFGVAGMFDSILSLVGPSYKNNFIQLILDIDTNAQILGYENELIQAFINIINNAKDTLINIKDEEERLLFIKVSNESGNVQIEIKDSGGGVDESIISRIFEPYFTTKHQKIGTGLGLSMADRIIRQRHKGEITVNNVAFEYNDKSYKGACFIVTL
jgi:PAS domain S-box-containing protein